MSLVTIAEAWPAAGRPFTVADLERFGVPSYWIVNPDPPEPELTVFELRDGRYVAAAKTPGPFAADRPFTVTIAPARLVAGLPR
jgi:hypothetical protein